MDRRDFSLAVGREALACDIIGEAAGLPISTLVLHGAGQSSRARQWPLRHALAALGVGSIACDFSGHGHSTAHEVNSLEKRLREAQALLSLMDEGARNVVGVSMGGEIALRLACLPSSGITHVITLVGALYDGAAFSLPFGPAFSAALRRPGSWRDADVLRQLRSYTGHLTVIRATDDQVIPADIAEHVQANAHAARSFRMVDLEGVDHRVSERCAQDRQLCDRLAALIAQADY